MAYRARQAEAGKVEAQKKAKQLEDQRQQDLQSYQVVTTLFE